MGLSPKSGTVILRVYRRELFFIALFALLHGFIFHFPAISWAAFISLVPFFLFLESAESRREAFILGYLAGVLFCAICYYWVIPVSAVGYLALVLYLGVYPALFAVWTYSTVIRLAGTSPGRQSVPWFAIFSIAAMWVLIEYLRSRVPVLRFPWALLGYSQWKNIIFIQSADHIGAYGISFLIALVNVALYAVISAVRGLMRGDLSVLSTIKDMAIPVVLASSIVGANLAYGSLVLDAHGSEVPRGDLLRVALIQGNIPQNQKFDARIRDVIFRKYEGLSRQAALEDPDLVIWPETAFPGFWEIEPEMVWRLKKTIADLKTHFLIGAPTLRLSLYDDKARAKDAMSAENMNTALYFDPDGREIGRYDKLRLVPFGEYVPIFKFLKRIYPIGSYSPGDAFVLMTFPRTVIASPEGPNQSLPVIASPEGAKQSKRTLRLLRFARNDVIRFARNDLYLISALNVLFRTAVIFSWRS